MTKIISFKKHLFSAERNDFTSAILDLEKEDRRKKIDFLLEILKKPIKVERIFQASQHEFKSSAFHEKCDGIEDTLVLVRT